MQPERLQARIRHQLSLPAPDLEARALAQELSEMGLRARERLEQCATLIRVGNEQAALQAAETEPSLPELCAWISFAGSGEWARLCEKHGLPVTQAPDDAQVLAVELLYGKPIDENHPLYRDYRQAIRERDEARALSVLRSITAVNPGDANAQSELKRLRAKFMRSSLDKVTEHLRRGETEAAAGLMDRMEQLGTATLFGDAAWDQALRQREEWARSQARRRLAEHLGRAAEARRRDDWRVCADAIGAIRTLERNAGITAEGTVGLAELERWAGELVAAEAAEHRARAEADDLRAEWTRLSAEAGRNLTADLLRRLNRWTERAEASGGRIAAEQLSEAHRLARAVRQRVVRRHTLRIAGGVTALLGLVLGAHIAYQSVAARSALDEVLGAAEQPAAAWDFEAAEQAIDRAAALATNDELRAELATRSAELRRRMQPLRAREQALAAEAAFVSAARESGLGPENFVEVRRRAKSLENALAEVGPAAAVRLRAKSGDLAEVIAGCDKVASGLRAQVDSLVAELEKAAGDGERLANPAQAEAVVGRIRAVLASPGATVAVGNETGDRAMALCERVNERLALERARQGTLRRLSGAPDLHAYLSEIRTLAEAAVDSPERAAARRINGQAETLALLPRALLGPRTAAMWDAAGTPEPRTLAPNPEESRIIAQLADNEALRNLRKYIIREHVSPEPGVSESHARESEYVSGGLTTEIRRLQGGTETVYSGKVLRSSGDLVERQWSLRTFSNGVISGKQPTEGLPLPEVDYLRRFTRFFGGGTGALPESPLRTLERVRRETGTPLLRAYHLQELFRLAAVRPSESGLAFSPSAQRDADALRGITQNRLNATDFAFETDAALKSELAKFHASNTVNYVAEAQYLRAMLTALRRGATSLVGQVGLDGKPVWKTAPTGAALLLGIDADGKPAILFECSADGSARPTGNAAPLSPLLRLSVTPSEAAEMAGEAPSTLPVPSGGWNNLLKGRDL